MTHTIDIEKLARGLQAARVGQGLTQHALARETDMHVNHVRKIEQGKADFTKQKDVERIATLAAHLDMKLPRLRNGAATEPKPTIVETRVGPIEEAPRFAPGELTMSCVDEPRSNTGATPWAKAPVHEPEQEDQSEPGEKAGDIEMDVLRDMCLLMERIKDDPYACQRNLTHLLGRYVTHPAAKEGRCPLCQVEEDGE